MCPLDPSNSEILIQAGIEDAKVVIITIPDPQTSEDTVKQCKQLNPGIRIIARSHLARHKNILEQLGVEYIVEPEYEAALSIVNRLLKYLGKTKHERKVLLHK